MIVAVSGADRVECFGVEGGVLLFVVEHEFRSEPARARERHHNHSRDDDFRSQVGWPGGRAVVYGLRCRGPRAKGSASQDRF